MSDSISGCPVVYLDTQDYSRFGDVIRGKSDAATEALFLDLERKALAGDVVFATSMPLMGELLQYDADFRDTTISKAEAVERLCGPWALAFPSRLVASEMAEAAERHGLIEARPRPRVLSNERYWFPNLAEEMANLRSTLRQSAQATVAELALPTRVLRRRAKKLANQIDLAAMAHDAAPEFAAAFGLPVDVVLNSIVALLRGRIDADAAARCLFRAVAEPVKFVETYFEKVELDRSEMPSWMRDFGAQFEQKFIELREKLEPFMKLSFAFAELEKMLINWPESLGRAVFGMAREDLQEFGMSSAEAARLGQIDGIFNEVPACYVVGRVLVEYTRQILGLAGTPGRVERSFGGDLVHALYLPHVDLWRGDRRFAEVVRTAVPRYGPRIVSRPGQLPERIDAWNRGRSENNP